MSTNTRNAELELSLELLNSLKQMLTRQGYLAIRETTSIDISSHSDDFAKLLTEFSMNPVF